MEVKKDNKYGITFSGERRDVAKYIVDVENELLIIKQKSNQRACLLCNSQPVHVVITTPQVSEVTARNVTDITLPGTLVTKDVSFNAFNASNIAVEDLATNKITAVAENVSRITLSGKSTILIANAINAANIDALDLIVETAEVEGDNITKIYVNVTDELKAKVINIAQVRYLGEPKVIKDVRSNEMGSIEPYDDIENELFEEDIQEATSEPEFPPEVPNEP